MTIKSIMAQVYHLTTPGRLIIGEVYSLPGIGGDGKTLRYTRRDGMMYLGIDPQYKDCYRFQNIVTGHTTICGMWGFMLIDDHYLTYTPKAVAEHVKYYKTLE